MTDHLRKLPPKCYGLLDGRAVLITRGAREPVPVKQQPGFVDWANLRHGITFEQRRAMECGVTFGWDHPSADPGATITLGTYQVELPLLMVCTVEAYSPEDAVNQVSFKVPEGCEVDGTITASATKI